MNSATQLRARLKGMGLADEAIDAAWPSWWSDAADTSLSARTELSFGVARRLGLDPGSLLDDRHELRFLWRDEARFKHLSSENDVERAGIASFGRAVAGAMIGAVPPVARDLSGISAREIREGVLKSGSPFVGLIDLVRLCWGVGVPVVHLRVFPWPQKRMAAMTVRVGERSCVLLGKDARYPAPIAYYLAHEMGHIALSHVEADRALVDLDTGDPVQPAGDDEEAAADAFALELLTGRPQPVVLPDDGTRSARELARVALSAAEELAIEPGTLALCFGYSTRDWRTANASMKAIYRTEAPVWQVVNAAAMTQLKFSDIPEDAAEFLETVLEHSSRE